MAIEQSLAKTAVQDVLKKAVGGIGSLFGVKTPGAKRDGNSKSNALYVTNVPDGATAALPGDAFDFLQSGGHRAVVAVAAALVATIAAV